MATLTNVGLQYGSKLFNGVSVAPFKYLANGSGDAVEDVANTVLDAENSANGSARKAATCTYEGSYTAKMAATWTASGAGFTVREIGVFDTAVSGGNLGIRHVYAEDHPIEAGEQVTAALELVDEMA